MKLYIATEHMMLLGTCAGLESENLGGQVCTCPTRKDAVNAIRAFIH